MSIGWDYDKNNFYFIFSLNLYINKCIAMRIQTNIYVGLRMNLEIRSSNFRKKKSLESLVSGYFYVAFVFSNETHTCTK